METKQEYNARLRLYMKDRLIALKIRAIKYKGDVCMHCNQKYPYPCYDFHHLDPNEKEFVWGQLRNYKWEIIKNELDKCILLCANCHRLEHSNYTELTEKIVNWFETIENKKPKKDIVKKTFKKTKINWPTPEEIKILIWKKPIREVAKDLKVSDVAIHKYCKKHNIQKPPIGYWLKLVGLEGSDPSSTG